MSTAGGRSNVTTNRTLIFNVLRYTTRQAILLAARKNPLIIEGRKIRFSPDYSNYTVKRRQAFQQVMNAARNKGLDFFLLYPATLKIKEGSQYRAFTSAKDAEMYVDCASTHPSPYSSPHSSPWRPGPAMAEALDIAPDDAGQGKYLLDERCLLACGLFLFSYSPQPLLFESPGISPSNKFFELLYLSCL